MRPTASELHARVAAKVGIVPHGRLMRAEEDLLEALASAESRPRVADELLLALLASGLRASTLLDVLDEAVALLDPFVDHRTLDTRAHALATRAIDLLEQRHHDEVRSLVRRVGHDPLTGLPNRRSVLNELTSACARARRLKGALLVAVVQVTPHPESQRRHPTDATLIELATRLRESGRPSDLVGRVDDETFLVAREAVLDQEVAQGILDRIADRLREPIPTASTPPDVQLAGVLLAHARPEAQHLLEALEDFVDHAAPAMRPRLVPEDLLATPRSHRAPFGGLELRYQPIVQLASGAIKRVEALARFELNGTLQPPGRTVAQLDAEERHRLFQAVLEEVARDATSGLLAYPVSVNVEPDLVSRLETAHWIDQLWSDTGLPPDRLTLEITETQSLYSLAVEPLGWLRTRGYQIALDDFGTGYASLSRVLSFDFSQYKLDRLFSDPVELIDRGLVLLLVAAEAATLLSADLVVEGVEDHVSLAVLRTLGLPLGQGFLLCPPLSIAELAAHPLVVRVDTPPDYEPVVDAVRLFRWERAVVTAGRLEPSREVRCPACVHPLPSDLAPLHQRQHALADQIATGDLEAIHELTHIGHTIRSGLLARVPSLRPRGQH